MLQTFPGHFVRIPKKYPNNDRRHKHQNGGEGAVVEPMFDVGFKETKDKESKSTSNDKMKSSYEKIWPNNKYLRNQNNQKLLQNGKLKEFRGNNLVALASFPGSGNTWLRYLLQQATGWYINTFFFITLV